MNNGGLTPAERRVASCLMDGMMDKEIEVRLCLAASTVKNTMTSIRRKLGAKNRTHAVVILYRRRWHECGGEGWEG